MSGNRARFEAKVFWERVQERNAATPPSRKIQPGTSCGSCGHYKGYRCLLKHKLVKPYNVCPEWKEKK